MLRLSFFFFKQKTAYEMRISDWSSDVCSSDLQRRDAEDVDAVDPGDDEATIAGHRNVELRVRGTTGRVDAELATERRATGVVAPRIQSIGRASCRERECQYV